MTALMHNGLRFYTLSVTESADMAEKMAQEFENKFDSLGKYDQMELAFKIEMDGWESAFEVIDSY